VGGGERPGVAAEDHADAKGEEEALVGIEDDRMGPLDPLKDAPAVLGQQEEAAVRRVDMEPAVLAESDVGDGVERIDRAGVRRAGGGENQPGLQARGAIGGDRRSQSLGPHAEALVRGDVTHLRLAHAG
jgi:hypothetical protein